MGATLSAERRPQRAARMLSAARFRWCRRCPAPDGMLHRRGGSPAVAELMPARSAGAPDLPQPGIAAAVPAVEVVPRRVLAVVVLVVVFRGPEWPGVADLRDDRTTPPVLGLQRRLRRFGQPALPSVVHENRGPVGFAAIAELPARVERIDVVPEHLEQALVGDLGGVEDDTHRLEVARAARADLGVARPLGVAAGVARGGGHYTL